MKNAVRTALREDDRAFHIDIVPGFRSAAALRREGPHDTCRACGL
jgi:hypothetical protein